MDSNSCINALALIFCFERASETVEIGTRHKFCWSQFWTGHGMRGYKQNQHSNVHLWEWLYMGIQPSTCITHGGIWVYMISVTRRILDSMLLQSCLPDTRRALYPVGRGVCHYLCKTLTSAFLILFYQCWWVLQYYAFNPESRHTSSSC